MVIHEPGAPSALKFQLTDKHPAMLSQNLADIAQNDCRLMVGPIVNDVADLANHALRELS